MQSYLKFIKIWEDNDISELLITANDGVNTFSVKVYVDHQEFENIYKKLNIYKKQIFGGITEIELGKFGPEYASGAFNVRLHYVQNQKGRIFLTIKMQSEYFNFGLKNVASEINLFLITEPALLDNFINYWPKLDKELDSELILECIEK